MADHMKPEFWPTGCADKRSRQTTDKQPADDMPSPADATASDYKASPAAIPPTSVSAEPPSHSFPENQHGQTVLLSTIPDGQDHGRDQDAPPANPTFASLFGRAVDAFVLVDRQGRLTDANPAACALVGYTRADLLGLALTAFGKPVIRGWIGVEDIFGFDGERNLPKRAENQREIEPAFVADLPNGQLLFILHDVTRHHRLLDALVETSQAATVAEKVKHEFLSNMSHELRTPIGGILGLSTLLRPKVEPGHAQYLDLIIQSAESLSAIVGDILEMARIEASQVAPNPGTVELAPALAQMFEEIRRQASAKDLEAILTISPRVPAQAVLAWEQTRKALDNLLSNAVKFTSRGWVNLFVDHCVDETGRECLYFAVTDSGLGIASEDLPRLFQPFTQLERPLNKHTQGTGLGLALAKRLAELAGGSIWLDSEPGRGSTFHLRVPCTPLS
ncbi:HAMP domain-containing sensor histidine kinase [Desulfocurvibacter africanus]|uniref:sensor histidine kinase n=1 Tax=Desulfocurvibacter africanus TaxID=873 RepID=UPI002FDB0CC2